MILRFKEYFQVNEGFKSSDMPKVLNSIVKYLSGKIGTMYLLPGEEEIHKKGGGNLVGIHFTTENCYGIRFNWDRKEAGTESIHSIDFFNDKNIFEPAITITMNGESIARILPAVVEVFNKQLTKIDFEKFVNESLELQFVSEARVRRTKAEVMAERKAIAAALGKAMPEESSTKAEKKAKEDLDAIEYADPETIFDDVDSFVQMVIDGLQPSLILTGLPGVGKTYGITQIMKRNGKKLIEPIEIPDGLDMDELEDAGFSAQEETDGDWVHVKGSSSAFGLYMNLYKYKNKIVVFDDCDSVFSDKDAVNLLKAALDTSEKRVLSWISKATTGNKAIAPPRFEFKGQIIFISNLYMKKIDSAVRGRSFVVDITLRAKDIILRIKSILPHIGKDVLSMKSKQMALEYLEEYADKRPELEVSIRSLMRAALIIESGNPNWRRMIEIQNKNS